MFMLLLSLAVLGAEAGLLRQPQQLAAGGAATASGANPEVDAWHDAEKAKIEEECDEMMRALWTQKRAKLQAIVDALRKQVEAERARVKAAEDAVGDEIGQLGKEKDHLKAASKPVDLDGPRKDVSDAEARIRELEKLIAELEACVDELHDAERELEEALRRLAEAERKVQMAKDAHADQVTAADREASHVPPAQDDVDAAEDDIARAKARVAAAEKRLAKAKADLAEHDGGAPAAPAKIEEAPAPAPAPAPKSGGHRVTTSLTVAVAFAMLFF